METDPAHLAPTHDNVQALFERSECTVAHMGEKTTVLHCTLPNGYELVTTSSCVDPEDYDEEVGLEACFDKLEEKVINLLAFQQHGELE